MATYNLKKLPDREHSDKHTMWRTATTIKTGRYRKAIRVGELQKQLIQ